MYQNDLKILQKTIDSFLQIPLKKRIFLIDNSKNNILEKEFIHADITYIFVGKNIGFGAGNNKILQHSEFNSKYHLILNPDVSFSSNVVLNLIKEFKDKEQVSMIAPKVRFPDGSHQYSCRRFPTPKELIIRRIGIFKKIFKSIINNGEYRDKDLTLPFYPDVIHGSFMLFKSNDFIKIGAFDERYFLYMEDVDICKKIDAIGKKILYHPNEQITHIHAKESSKRLYYFFIHIKSSIKYFKKWGF